MKKVILTDETLANSTPASKYNFTFRKKIEVAEILDKIGVSVSLGKLTSDMADTLLIKSVAGVMKNTTLSVCTGFDENEIEAVFGALKEALHPRLQICAALSTARMEYVYHKKAPEMLKTIENALKKCKELCSDVEFIAEDATRADYGYLCDAISIAIKSGATTVTVCDTAGVMLPEEFGEFISKLFADIEDLSKVTLGVNCSNTLNIADAVAFSAVKNGAEEIKASATLHEGITLAGIANLLINKSKTLDFNFDFSYTDIFDKISKIKKIGMENNPKSPFENSIKDYSEDTAFGVGTTVEEISGAAKTLGYDLSEDDILKVYNAFKKVLNRKESVTIAEIDSIIAAEAMQVDETYTLESFVVTTGNAIDISAHVKLKKDGKMLDGLSLGAGPIDAAFLAIENITGHHYELDDFQIKAISEGRSAMGQTVVKLRSRGKVYSGIGTSTDIIGSGVAAYINALNKIIYEEEN